MQGVQRVFIRDYKEVGESDALLLFESVSDVATININKFFQSFDPVEIKTRDYGNGGNFRN
jgi:hypothetical protein